MQIRDRGRVEKHLRALMEEQPSVRFAYLYGSHAFGYARGDSDVDVAAYFAANGDETPEWSLQETLSRQLSLRVEVINLNGRAAANFFRQVLPNAVVVKDSPERMEWERERSVMAGEEEGTLEDYLEFVLDSMTQKSAKLREALPLLDDVDLNQVKQGDLTIVSSFLGRFFVVFQPLEALARRMANYVYLTTGRSAPTELKDQILLLVVQVGLDEAAAAPLAKFANVRNKLAHAYWNLKEEELNNGDLRLGHKVLAELTACVDAFAATARERLTQRGDQVS